MEIKTNKKSDTIHYVSADNAKLVKYTNTTEGFEHYRGEITIGLQKFRYCFVVPIRSGMGHFNVFNIDSSDILFSKGSLNAVVNELKRKIIDK